MIMSDYLDGNRLKEWSHKDIIMEETGTVYTLNKDERSEKYELRSFQPTNQKWELLNQFETPYASNFSWDISQSLFAYGSKNESVKILKKDGFEKTADIASNCTRLQISPNQKDIAILEYSGRINIGKRNSWHQVLGVKSKLLIFEITSGECLNTNKFYVFSSGLSWSPDSTKLLLVALDDRSLLGRNLGGEVFIEESHPEIIYLFDIESNSITKLCEGTGPAWSPDGRKFLFIKNGQILTYNFADAKIETLCPSYGARNYKWSPSGQNVLGLIRTQNPMWINKFFLTVINIDNPERKFVLDVGSDYRGFDWCK